MSKDFTSSKYNSELTGKLRRFLNEAQEFHAKAKEEGDADSFTVPTTDWTEDEETGVKYQAGQRVDLKAGGFTSVVGHSIYDEDSDF